MKYWFKGEAKEQFKMDFKKCSEVYGYKSIAEVEEEELEAKIKDTKLEMVDAMFAIPKLTDADISSISVFPVDDIQKRRAQR
ncbi:hypothetical protein B7982_08945 [Fibrobacter sp. UWB2]|uniref:hypothetical protein n=1 Tax=Fibrobacter sp. UWB2 TaxID=1964358 RepID=UPI000B527D9E|nr:hypothetical protein [Fibrobacter sp. UWB2]OWV22345.1 hypothetical protein B7982_08945 [Fibrobacter sp. UWB2]